MRSSTGLALVAVGAILLCAVNVSMPFLDLKVTGFVLLCTGLAGLRAPQHLWRWASAHSDDLRFILEHVADEGEPVGKRVPLEALLVTLHTASPLPESGSPAS